MLNKIYARLIFFLITDNNKILDKKFKGYKIKLKLTISLK